MDKNIISEVEMKFMNRKKMNIIKSNPTRMNGKHKSILKMNPTGINGKQSKEKLLPKLQREIKLP